MPRRMIRPSIELLLDREVAALDEIMAEVRGGIRHQRHLDELEERATAVAAGLIAAFRGGQ